MAIALTELDTKQRIGGDNYSKHYSVAISGTYPAGGTGYIVNTAAFPGGVADFKSIKRVFFTGGNMDENGVFFRVDNADEIFNTTDNSPYFYLRAYNQVTGGAGPAEVSAGDALVAALTLVVEGVIYNGVNGDSW